jgi:hypothetical protein
MQASQPYFIPGGSDGDQSGGDEGRRFKYRVQKPYNNVASKIERRENLRFYHKDPIQGSDEGDGGSLADYVNSVAEGTPGPADVGSGTQVFGDLWSSGGTIQRHLFLSA